MSQQAWFEHFKEQLHGLTESFAESGTSVSLLSYALQEKRLSPEKYLAWAMSHYLLPQLQSRFFTETPLSQEMFARWATHYPWSAECLPVAEWDGSLIVACLQPPQDFPSNPTSIIVLASPENLQMAWKTLHPEKAKIPANPVMESSQDSAPEGIDMSAATMVAPRKSDVITFDDLGVESSAPKESTSEEEGVEGLEGLDADSSSGQLDGLFDGATVVQLKSFNAAEAHPPAAEATVVKPKEDMENIFKDTAESAPDSTIEKTTISPISRTSRITKPHINPVAAGHFALEKIKKKNSAILDEKIHHVLKEMKVYYQKSLILTLDESESQMTVFAWDDNFLDMKDPSVRLPLKVPSIFNIVASTQKPFHGYISLNEINEKFFEDWNQGQIPDHVTITPLIIKDSMVGMLMGFGEKSAYNRSSLNLAEKLSSDFVRDLKVA